jgi:hypothetical protein
MASRGGVTFEEAPAVEAMASVFEQPSQEPIPPAVAAKAASLVEGAPTGMEDLPGEVLVEQGRLLLSNLGPKQRSIYVFPTTHNRVCFVITGLSAGCKKAFIVGEPASISGSVLYFPPTSGPPAELAGLTKDGVSRAQVVLDGTPKDAIFGHDAWYYRFPSNEIPATAATALIVTRADGSTATVPTRIRDPRLTS